MTCRKVAIPIDASEHSERACDWYFKNMYRKDGDKVFIIHVSEMAPQGKLETITKEDWDQHVKDHTQKVKDLEEKYKAKMCCEEADFAVKLLSGAKPGEAIVKAIKECEADVVVMGSRGMGVLRRTFVGSVSDYVMHHAHVPVIICPKQ
ncbi:universal stress protein Slr1101-like [Montipora foliosa]|uniref:universal stress protein Slr1101-like n=1 Tax=Montipora foliosa TaxID=591990 RepID=UPI0035F0FCA2